MAVAEANGGRAFRAQHRVVRRSLSAGNLWWAFPQDTTRIFWLVQYEAIGPGNSRLIFSAFVDMVTGEFLRGGITGVQEPVASIPTEYSLSQNYPNPFNPTTTIRFSLPQREHVTLQVLDMLGRKVATLVDGDIISGEHTVVFDAKGLASGVYFYRFVAGNFIETKKLMLLR